MGLLDPPGVARSTADLRYAQRFAGVTLPRWGNPEPVMSSPPTVGTCTTTTSLTGTLRQWAATSEAFHLTGARGTPTTAGGSFPQFNYLRWTSLSNGPA